MMVNVTVVVFVVWVMMVKVTLVVFVVWVMMVKVTGCISRVPDQNGVSQT